MGLRDILAQMMAGGGSKAPVGQDAYKTLLDREMGRFGSDRDQAVRNANIAGGFGNSTAQQFMHPAAAVPPPDPMATGGIPANVPIPVPRPDMPANVPIPAPRPVPIASPQQAIDAAPYKMPLPANPPIPAGRPGVPADVPIPIPAPRPARPAKKRSQYRLT